MSRNTESPPDGPFEDHFRRPRHTGVLEGADGRIEVENPVCGDVLVLYWKAGSGASAIDGARFQVYGCPAAIAAGSLLTDGLVDGGLEALASWTPETVAERLGGLDRSRFHAAVLAIDALVRLREAVRSGSTGGRRSSTSRGKESLPRPGL